MNKINIKSRTKVFLLILVFILIGLSTAVALYRSFSTLEQKRSEQVTKTMDEALDLYRNGKELESLSVYDKALNERNNSEQEYNLLLGKTTLLINIGEYDKALIVAQRMHKSEQTLTTVLLLAQIYELKHDNQNAIINYKKVIEIIENNNYEGGTGINYYRSKLSDLEGEN